MLVTILFMTICFLILRLRQMSRRIVKLVDISSKYQELLLEYARIQEKCNLLDDKSHKYDSLQFDYKELEKENCSLKIHLEQERKNLAEKINLLERAEEKFRDTFKALSSEPCRQKITGKHRNKFDAVMHKISDRP